MAEFNGTTTTLIPNLGASDYGISSTPISFASNLYFTYGNINASTYQLAKYDGSNISLIPNLNTTDFGMNTEKIVFQNNLYTAYQNSNNKRQLVKYDGTNLTYIPNLNANDGGVSGSFLEFNNKLYFIYYNASNKGQLASYDGNTITVYPNPNSVDPGVNELFLYNGSINFRYQNSINQNNLGTFTGTGISIIANPNSSITGLGTGLLQNHAIYNGNLYFNYNTFIGVQNLGSNLAKFDGTNITLIPSSPSNGVVVSNTIYNNSLVMSFYDRTTGETALATFDGTSISIIPNPLGRDCVGEPIVYNNVLYAKYRITSTGQNVLGYLNGNSISTIPNPNTALSNFGYKGNPIIYNSKLYFNYETGYSRVRGGGSVTWPNNNSQLGLLVLPCTPTTSSTDQSICASQLPFTWNGLIFTASGTQSKTFTGGNTQGCDSTATLVLTVNQPTTSTNNKSICASQLPYSWDGLTFTAAGTQTKTGLTNAAGCDSTANYSLTVTANPTPTISGTLSFCPGASTTLDAGAGYDGYSWSNGETTQTIDVRTAGSYTVTVSVTPISIVAHAGCEGTSPPVTTIVKAAPTPSITPAGNTTFCRGDSVLLNAAPVAANRSYQWIRGTSTIVGATANNYVAKASGKYKVRVTNTITGCSRTSTSQAVTNNSLPSVSSNITGIKSTCFGGTSQLGNATAGGTWSSSNDNIATVSSTGLVTGVATGTVTITYTTAPNVNNCVNKVSTLFTVSGPCFASSVDERGTVIGDAPSALDASIFPNPTSNVFNVRIKTPKQESISIRVLDVNGKTALASKRMPGQNFTFGEQLTAGTYMVEVRQGEEVRTLKIVKMRK